MKTYEDKYFRNRVSTIIQQQKMGKVLVDAYKSGTGLPAKDELGAVLTLAPFPHDYQVGGFGWLDCDRDSGMYVFIPRPGAELPAVLKDCKPLSLVEAMVDSANKTIHIQTVETIITFTSAPVWSAGYSLMKDINEELARQDAGVVVWKLSWENEETATGLFAGPAPRLRNAHAIVTLTGYALDTDNQTLVYFGCVGYKTSIESIRATLITGKP